MRRSLARSRRCGRGDAAGDVAGGRGRGQRRRRNARRRLRRHAASSTKDAQLSAAARRGRRDLGGCHSLPYPHGAGWGILRPAAATVERRPSARGSRGPSPLEEPRPRHSVEGDLIRRRGRCSRRSQLPARARSACGSPRRRRAGRSSARPCSGAGPGSIGDGRFVVAPVPVSEFVPGRGRCDRQLGDDDRRQRRVGRLWALRDRSVHGAHRCCDPDLHHGRLYDRISMEGAAVGSDTGRAVLLSRPRWLDRPAGSVPLACVPSAGLTQHERPALSGRGDELTDPGRSRPRQVAERNTS